MSEIILTEDNFDNEVLQSDVPVLVDFWAPWCGPCRVQGPIIEELAKDMAGKPAKIGKLNVDEHNAISTKYDILSIPTLGIFKGGQMVEQFVGVQAKDKLQAALEKHA
ncbi:TPA: thioredoxin [Patescibacteria group bacterium]|nr:thioredoxin [Patescibacteria group bacterium]